MGRPSPSDREKKRLASLASQRGDKAVADESGWAEGTIAQWRRDRGLPPASSRGSALPDEVLAAAPTRAGAGALNLVVSEQTRLLPSVSGLSLEERRRLADRSVFPLNREARRQWEEMNERPAQDLPDLREFMQRRSECINYGDDHTTEDAER